MDTKTVTVTGTIALQLTKDNADQIVTVFDAAQNITPTGIDPKQIISVNSFIKNLRAKAIIKSIAEAPLPQFLLEDSQTDKLYKTLDIEWKSPRKQLDLYVAKGGISYSVYAMSMLNPMGYPFRIYNLMDAYTDGLAVELGSDGAIQVSIEDVGYGLLSDKDSINISGSYVREFEISIPDESSSSNSGGSGGSIAVQVITSSNHTVVQVTTPVKVLDANLNRKYLLIVNDSDVPVYLKFGTLNTGDDLLSGICLTGRGGSYEFICNPTQMPLQVNAATQNSGGNQPIGSISITECV